MKQYTSDLERAEVTLLVPEGVTVAKAVEEAKGLVEFMLGPEPEPEHPAPPPPREEPRQTQGPPPASRGGYGGGGGYQQQPRSYGGGGGGTPRPKLCRENCGVEIVWDQRMGQRGAFVNAHDCDYGRAGEMHRCQGGGRR